MAENYCRCDSWDAYAWLASTFGDKGQTLQRQIDAIRKTIVDNNLPLEFFLKPSPRIFTDEDATRINAAVKQEASLLDQQLDRVTRGAASATRESTTLMKEMVLAILKESDLVNTQGRHVSESLACKMLGWRRPEHRFFSCSLDVMRFYGSISHGECFGREANSLINNAYARIKKEI